MKSLSRRQLQARIAIRDRLIRGIIGHLKRRGDPTLTSLVERAAGLVWENDDWLTDSRIGLDIRAFARMDLSRGKQKGANTGPGTIRAAKRAALLVESYIRTAEDERDPDDDPNVPIQGAWRECLGGAEPLDGARVQQVLKLKTIEGKAIRLVFWATRKHRSQQRFVDFRKQIASYSNRPHPWIVR